MIFWSYRIGDPSVFDITGGRHHLILFSFSLFSLSYEPFSIFVTIFIFTDGIAVELHTAFTTLPSARFPQFSVCIHTSTVTDRVNIALVFSLLICDTWKLQLGNNYKLYQQTNTGWLLCANVFHLSLSWEAVHRVCRISGCARVCCFMVIIDLGQKNWAGSLEKQYQKFEDPFVVGGCRSGHYARRQRKSWWRKTMFRSFSSSSSSSSFVPLFSNKYGKSAASWIWRLLEILKCLKWSKNVGCGDLHVRVTEQIS